METYHGYVRTPADAIKLFEACRLGILPRVQRRLSEKERQSIRSGSVFVWDEREAGMRRWTDGKSWSASRVSGSFLTYREMEGKRGGGFGTGRRGSGKTPDSNRGSDEDHDDGEPEGYRYKADGLMKQSFSITTSTGQHLHLISYYSRPQPGQPDLSQPTNDPSLRGVVPVKGMYPESSMGEVNQTPALTRAPMQNYSLPPQPYPGQHYAPHYGTQQTHAWPPSPAVTPPYSHYTTAPPYATHGHAPPPSHHHPLMPQPPAAPSHYAPAHHYEPRASITLPPPQKSTAFPPYQASQAYRMPSPPRISDLAPPRESVADPRLSAAALSRNPHGPLPTLNSVASRPQAAGASPPSSSRTPTPPQTAYSEKTTAPIQPQPARSGLSVLLNDCGSAEGDSSASGADPSAVSEDHRALRMLDRSAFKQVVL
ncbi:hypothetical protein GMORB2_1368 [Geosmithia morbida]|uniref:cAMP-independent regulatory protein pac2 n=1 Tax=Geosmithia morbida TaxID=1094350 RepID=A0A9P5D4J6_9HYPO|nr:uncharacterized protein GMORB2_1368 [Geosmithia morbida]KAF4126122.1 hypothetical protein GMORB2_1368 [Geosmithia morbida]